MSIILNQNYDALFQKALLEIKKDPRFAEKKPRLLLHVCCAPCSSAVLEQLVENFSITVYFFNPNIHPREEYARRQEELKLFLAKCSQSKIYGAEKIVLQCAHYEPNDYFEAVETEEKPHLKVEKERGERCSNCYELRIKESALYALENKFDYFTTALSISPHKDAQKINLIGEKIQNEISVKTTAEHYPIYLYADFKKRHGFKRSVELSGQFNLYRQEYCGCIYSQLASKKEHLK